MPRDSFIFDLTSSFLSGPGNMDLVKLEKLKGISLASVPYLTIHSAIYAELAFQISKQGKKDPGPSMGNDVEIVAAYLPYVDKIFVDREMHSILNSNNVKGIIGTLGAKVFSAKNMNSLIDWLVEVEAAIPGPQKQLAERIYL